MDLDLTVVDSTAAELLRKGRKWSEVYKLVGQFVVYPGILEFMTSLRSAACRLAIVTSSPRSYFSKVVAAHALPFDVSVCFHDCPMGQHKPHPFSILRAVELMGLTPHQVVSIGDAATDIHAAKSAKVYACGAEWGAGDLKSLTGSEPDRLLESVSELDELLRHIARTPPRPRQ